MNNNSLYDNALLAASYQTQNTTTKPKPLKFALSGKIASGKTTTSKSIARRTRGEVKVLSFAKRLKDIVSELFTREDDQYSSMPFEDYVLRDEVSRENAMGKQRKLLQDFGTKVREIDPNAWVNALDKQARECERNGVHIIVDDLRMPNEYAYCKHNGYILIRLEVSRQVQEKRIKRIYNNYEEHLSRLDHHTEVALDSYPFDYVIHTDNPSEINEKIGKIMLEVKKNQNTLK